MNSSTILRLDDEKMNEKTKNLLAEFISASSTPTKTESVLNELYEIHPRISFVGFPSRRSPAPDHVC
jgi:hypothetical protein